MRERRISAQVGPTWLAVLLMCFVPGQALAANDASQKRCYDQMIERASALVAEDWPQVQRVAHRLIKTCVGILDSSDIANAYADIAIAYSETGHYVEAVRTADLGINTYYACAACHHVKVEALISGKAMVRSAACTTYRN